MPRRCSVCAHAQRDEIDHAIVSGQSLRGIARRFAAGQDAVERHAKAHVPLALAEAQAATKVSRGDDLLEQLRDRQAQTERLYREAEVILHKAQECDDLCNAALAIRAAVAVLKEARSCAEVLHKALEARKYTITLEEALAFAEQIVRIVRANVHDDATLARISSDIDKLMQERKALSRGSSLAIRSESKR